MNSLAIKASKTNWVLLIIMCLEIPISFAQVLKGTVRSETGEALAGVNVMVRGTTRGVVTDIEGNFSLVEVNTEDVIEFSYVGYVSQEIKIGNQSSLDVTMQPDATLLDKIVIVGYGTQQKINLTGAIGIANSEVLQNRPIVNTAEGLKGVIPNLNITIPNGDPADDNIDINIRGYESINGGEPLILVDGVPMDLNRVNPQDIESISVLKDAASAAVYGGRAAFGVILVQTKKGERGKIKLSANMDIALAKPILFIDPISDPHQFVLAFNEASMRSSGSNAFDADYIENTKRWVDNPTTENAWSVYNGTLRFYGNNNYSNELITDYAPQQNYNVNVSGASESASYYVSFGHLNKDGYLRNREKNLKFKRYNVLMKGDFKINAWLNMDSRLFLSVEKSDKPHEYPEVGLNTLARISPMQPIIFPDLPYYAEEGDREQYEQYIGHYFEGNLFPYVENGGRDIWTRNELVLTQGINLSPLKGLNIRGEFSWNSMHFDKQDVQSRLTVIDNLPDLNTGNISSFGNSADDWILNESNNDQYFVVNAYADYTLNKSDQHFVKLMVGFNQEWGNYKTIGAKSSGLITPDIADLNATVGAQETFGGASEVALRGYFYRLNYIYKDRYLIEANGRYDGSSRFPKKDRWAFFPSFSVGWRLSNESFMSATSNWLDNLKLRASYGELGNQTFDEYIWPFSQESRYLIPMGTDIGFQLQYNNGPIYYPYLPSMSPGSSPYMFSAGQPSPYVAAANLVSPTLTWESVNTLNLGLDFTLLNNRLDVSFDAYQRNTLNMLMSVTYPQILGAEAPKENAADLQTRGWELAATWRKTNNHNWKYGFKLAFSDNISEITKYDNPTGSLDEYYVGQVIGERWGFETVGIFQNEEQILEAADQSEIGTNWRPGDMQYADLDGDGKITYGNNTLDTLGDRRIIAHESPRYNFGISGNVEWKGFNLSVFFQGTLKFDFWPPFLTWRAFYPFNSSHAEWYFLSDSWSPENPDAYFPAPHISRNNKQNILPQSHFVQDASYIRLKNLTFGYTLPIEVAQKIGLESFYVYFSGENLWEFTNMRKPLDPEVRPTMAQEYYKQRIYSLGLQVSL